ncbi:hypothetical protein [Salegentibacter sp. Hel_I_6]|uniref:hypothetical protein n=1 Tax=Salegentibacter sp. Hel_I_6 TaxID=1250278 RepID=UPI000562D201|nr:hypothetical protein [Salegentibacter sp. Hel_I_6]
MKLLKDRLFIKGLVYDALGMATMAIPVIGPFLDIIWAPYAAKKMSEMYPGKKGKVASVLVFLEEILPGTDIIPTFTLMYFYTFVWSKKEQEQGQVIEVEIIE